MCERLFMRKTGFTESGGNQPSGKIIWDFYWMFLGSNGGVFPVWFCRQTAREDSGRDLKKRMKSPRVSVHGFENWAQRVTANRN